MVLVLHSVLSLLFPMLFLAHPIFKPSVFNHPYSNPTVSISALAPIRTPHNWKESVKTSCFPVLRYSHCVLHWTAWAQSSFARAGAHCLAHFTLQPKRSPVGLVCCSLEKTIVHNIKDRPANVLLSARVRCFQLTSSC